MRYHHFVVETEAGRIVGFGSDEPGLKTAAGVAIGDPLTRVTALYAGAVCDDVKLGQSDTAAYRACQGRLASGATIWFGGDPIDSFWVFDDSSPGSFHPKRVLRRR